MTNNFRPIILISTGGLNLLHAGLHFAQFIQSMMMIKVSAFGQIKYNQRWLDQVLHSPILGAIWCVIGIITLWMGVVDFIHHKKCTNEN